MSKTRFALYFYYLAIGLLTACAIAIVVKLIVFPPCAPHGNTCVVDPWSAAGLEGTVLAVSATVLAILGAVAVAGWWTTLDRRVKDQVGVLYEDQKKEARNDLADFLTAQQREVSDRFSIVQTNLQSVESRINEATTDIDKLEEMTYKAEEMVIDGLMVLGAPYLEEWAKNAMTHPGFAKIPVTAVCQKIDPIHSCLLLSSGTYPQWLNHPRTSWAVTVSKAWQMASSSASRVLAPARRKYVLSLEKVSSIGEQSGE